MGEVFVPVVGYESLYLVGDQGTVKRVPDRSNSYRGKVLKPATHKDTKYPLVSLTSSGRTKTFNVHTLVLHSFSPAPTSGLEVRHKDGNRGNPCLSNLEWGTRMDNIVDKINHGRSGNKITSAMAADIKRRVNAGIESGVSIAKSYSISKSTICDIKAGRYWNHV